MTVASAMAYIPSVALAEYAASKAALVAYHECLRMELRRDGAADHVHLALVCPHHTDTSLFAGARLGAQWLVPTLQQDTVAAAIVGAIVERRSTVMVPELFAVLPAVRLLPAFFTDPILEVLGGRHGMDGILK